MAESRWNNGWDHLVRTAIFWKTCSSWCSLSPIKKRPAHLFSLNETQMVCESSFRCAHIFPIFDMLPILLSVAGYCFCPPFEGSFEGRFIGQTVTVLPQNLCCDQVTTLNCHRWESWWTVGSSWFVCFIASPRPLMMTRTPRRQNVAFSCRPAVLRQNSAATNGGNERVGGQFAPWHSHLRISSN